MVPRVSLAAALLLLAQPAVSAERVKFFNLRDLACTLSSARLAYGTTVTVKDAQGGQVSQEHHAAGAAFQCAVPARGSAELAQEVCSLLKFTLFSVLPAGSAEPDLECASGAAALGRKGYLGWVSWQRMPGSSGTGMVRSPRLTVLSYREVPPE